MSICQSCARYPKGIKHLRGCPRKWDARYEGIVLCMRYSHDFPAVDKDRCRVCGKPFRHLQGVPAQTCLRCSIDEEFLPVERA